MTTRELVRRSLPFAAIGLLVPVMLLPVGVLVPIAVVALVVSGLVALADWAARDTLVVRRRPARQEPDGASGWAVAQDQRVSSRRR